MDAYRLSVFAHIFFSILLVGLALFWVIMRIALRRSHAAESDRLLAAAQASRWPHVAVPYKLRLPLPWLTWAVFAAAWLSGAAGAALTGRAIGADWWPKWLLVGVLVLLQLALTWRVRAGLFPLQLGLMLATVALSAWLTRFA